MSNDFDDIEPDLTIVGGQPSKRRHRFEGKVKVPVGLEKLLYLAADDPAFKERLLDDRRATVEGTGISLRPSEQTILETADRQMLSRMIDGIVPSNPRRRKFMGLVAAAATSLAAGTAAMAGGCLEVDKDDHGVDAGVGGDTDTDTDTDTDMDGGDTDTLDTENPTDAGSWGALADDDIDGKF